MIKLVQHDINVCGEIIFFTHLRAKLLFLVKIGAKIFFSQKRCPPHRDQLVAALCTFIRHRGTRDPTDIFFKVSIKSFKWLLTLGSQRTFTSKSTYFSFFNYLEIGCIFFQWRTWKSLFFRERGTISDMKVFVFPRKGYNF